MATPKSPTEAQDELARSSQESFDRWRAGKPPKVSREILEDRYDGAIDTPDGSMTKTGDRLYRAVREVYEAVARQPWRGNLEEEGGHPPDGLLVDDAIRLVREHIIRRVDELDLAR
jgi:hypothetical protein